MSNRLPSLAPHEVIRALKKAGFEVTRIKGSHHIVRHRYDPTRGTVASAKSGGANQKPDKKPGCRKLHPGYACYAIPSYCYGPQHVAREQAEQGPPEHGT